jgi:hypothetical protein
MSIFKRIIKCTQEAYSKLDDNKYSRHLRDFCLSLDAVGKHFKELNSDQRDIVCLRVMNNLEKIQNVSK